MLRRLLPPVSFNPEFQKLWWAQILASVAFNTLTYALIIRIAQHTQSNTAVSFFILSFSLPALLVGLLAGVWVDRHDRKRIILFTNLLRTLLIPLFYLAEVYNFLWVYPLAIAMSIVTQFFIPAEAAKLSTLVKKDHLHSANSLFTFTLYASFILGPIAAGPALKYLGVGKMFWILGIIFAGATLCAWLLPKDKKDKNALLRLDMKSELFDAFRLIFNKKTVLGGLVLLTFSQALVSTVIAIAPGYARSVLGVSIEDTSLLMLAPAAGGMILASFALSRFVGGHTTKRMGTAGIFLAGVCLVLLGILKILDIYVDVNIVWISMALLFALGATNALVIVTAQTALQLHTPEELRGRIYGVLGTMVNGASFLPVLFAGILADTLGVATLVLLLGGLVILSGFYSLEKSRTL